MSDIKKQTDFLKNKAFKKFIKSKWYPGIFQWPVALVFAFIVYELIAGPSDAHDNFGTAGTWVLWWPLLPILLVLFGRFWCIVCPFGLLNDVVQKFVGNNKPVPKFLRKYGIWIIDITFLMITWSDHVWGVVENPRGSGILLLMITTAVIFSGALFERRTWCRYLCFLGGLSGNYSRAGMVELRGTTEVCKNCKTSTCYKGTTEVPGCPMFEFPKTMDSSAECNLCGNCVKNCPNDSIRISPRTPTKELWDIKKPKIEVAFLAIVIMGIVFVQNITMLNIWDELLHSLENILGTTNYYITFTVTFFIAMLIPVVLLLLTGLIAKKFNKASIMENFSRFGYAVIPLDLAGHIAHNLFHLLAEGKSVIYTAMELFKVSSHGASTALLSSPTIQVLQYIIIVLGTIGSIYTAYRIAKSSQNKETLLGTSIVYTILMVLLAVANIVLFSIPMAMRM
ncbi:4Fe-4S binding protein [Clostridium estertheticum]|uniref:4Fe-4S binding protein n=1 Tax=Clostridium estertheticum TaxID=238834 RepID=A0A7Y3SU12_9CLOT|nr:4Fe-4S binding protein [Clostridium estertheticum]MBW9173534.1 4Fe-4S binding protein [Clostridium estertheticum]NNU75368.1 4Fe-4S binding protein [Clostridium estertheticum]WBL48164.1 4Fe-4S binding protein [Clostridium estertheticum]WLC76250.1 4Fe-4S binding protein [Clostridium estertheticum]